MRNLLNITQKFFIRKKGLFISIFLALEIAIVLGIVIFSYISLKNFPKSGFVTYQAGKFSAIIAFVLYVLTLLPGIAKRINFLPSSINPIALILNLFRRHLGISMFLFAFAHYIFMRIIPIVSRFGFGPELLKTSTIETLGFLSLFTLLPLWLTSNDFSVKKLGKNWKKIHSLTYLALFFIFLHVLLQSSKWAIFGLIFLGLEVFSWIVFWRHQKNRKDSATQVLQ